MLLLLLLLLLQRAPLNTNADDRVSKQQDSNPLAKRGTKTGVAARLCLHRTAVGVIVVHAQRRRALLADLGAQRSSGKSTHLVSCYIFKVQSVGPPPSTAGLSLLCCCLLYSTHSRSDYAIFSASPP